ncbi:MAG: hypothetical protein GF320_00360 [Armatimonadia bacterium]|nr:hypothetical protein [Armatimonadia bacterium]
MRWTRLVLTLMLVTFPFGGSVALAADHPGGDAFAEAWSLLRQTGDHGPVLELCTPYGLYLVGDLDGSALTEVSLEEAMAALLQSPLDGPKADVAIGGLAYSSSGDQGDCSVVSGYTLAEDVAAGRYAFFTAVLRNSVEGESRVVSLIVRGGGDEGSPRQWCTGGVHFDRSRIERPDVPLYAGLDEVLAGKQINAVVDLPGAPTRTMQYVGWPRGPQGQASTPAPVRALDRDTARIWDGGSLRLVSQTRRGRMGDSGVISTHLLILARYGDTWLPVSYMVRMGVAQRPADSRLAAPATAPGGHVSIPVAY